MTINKRAISLLLVVSILLSMCPTIFAEELNTTEHTSGTLIEYTNPNATESYTVKVPAVLAPGDTGTVTLNGTWASNRIVTVTASESIDMANGTNTIPLKITFESIELAGSNVEAVSAEKEIKVAEMTDALFGVWEGLIEYNVSIETVESQGIAYGEPYSMTGESGKMTFILQEDGSAEVYNNGTLVQSMTAGSITYGVNSITIPSEDSEGNPTTETYAVAPDGCYIVMESEGGVVNYGPILESENTPIHFDKKYAMEIDDGILYLVFHEDGTVDMYDGDELLQTIPNMAVYGEKYVGLMSMIGSVSDDGTIMIFVPDEMEITLAREYAVQFKQLYSTTDANGDKLSYVFYKDGTVKYYINNVLTQTTSATYTETTFTLNDVTVTPTDNKTQFVLNELTYVLEEQSSVYVGESYEATVDSDKVSYIFNEDNTVSYYVNGTLTETISADDVIYGNGIVILDDTYAVIANDKTSVVTDGVKYNLKVTLIDGSNWYKGSTSKANITMINIVDSYTPDNTEIESWNIDNLNSGAYKAYVLSDGVTLVIAGNGNNSIVANEDSYYLFQEFSKVTVINGLKLLDTSNITTMSHMFYGCESLTELDLSNFDTSNVIYMSYMFNGCSDLTSLDVSRFNTSNVTNMSHMFSRCNKLTSLNVSNFDTSNVTDMSFMFYDCSGLTSLNLSSFDTSNVTNMSCMFYGCESLTEIDLSNFVTSNVTDMSFMFSGYMESMALTSLDISSFDTSNVTDMCCMFQGCSSLTSLDVSNFDTSNVTNMSSMFNGCGNLISLNLNNFDTSNVTNMSHMFSSCNKLTSLNVSNFDTSNVTDMNGMFWGCESLTELDLSSFDTANVTDMSFMFKPGWSNSSSLLQTIYVSDKWSTINVTESSEMFDNCYKLVGGSGTTYNSSYIDVTYAHIDGGTANPGYLTDIADKA